MAAWLEVSFGARTLVQAAVLCNDAAPAQRIRHALLVFGTGAAELGSSQLIELNNAGADVRQRFALTPVYADRVRLVVVSTYTDAGAGGSVYGVRLLQLYGCAAVTAPPTTAAPTSPWTVPPTLRK